MANGIKNGNLRWWHFMLTVLILVSAILGSYYTLENTANNTKIDVKEFKIETKERLDRIDDEIEDVDEIKINLKQLMNHFDLEYIEK